MSHILVITFLRSFSVASVGQSRGIMDSSAIYTPAFLHNLYLLWLLLSKAPPPYIHIYIFLSSSNIYAIKCTHFNCTFQWLFISIYSCNYHPVRDILQKVYTQWFVLIHTHTHTGKRSTPIWSTAKTMLFRWLWKNKGSFTIWGRDLVTAFLCLASLPPLLNYVALPLNLNQLFSVLKKSYKSSNGREYLQITYPKYALKIVKTQQ